MKSDKKCKLQGQKEKVQRFNIYGFLHLRHASFCEEIVISNERKSDWL